MSEQQIPPYMRFVIGGLSGCGASCFTHPLDLIKTRMQLSGMGGHTREHKTSLHAAVNVVRKEGFLGIYKGVSASLVRQATFTAVRLGVYSSLTDQLTKADGTPPTLVEKVVCGTVGGVAGAFVGTPADVALIRMAADGRLPMAERRNYKHVFDAFYRIVNEEGPLTLWRGTIPTMTRAVVVNMGVVAYYQAKEFFMSRGHFQDDFKCHLASSMVSGIVSIITSLPVDIAKTRLQEQKYIDGKPEYKGMIDVLSKVVKKEGVTALWKGITPAYMRIGPHTVIFFLFMENFTNLYKYYAYGQKQ